MEVANTLVYNDVATITVVKSFTAQVSGWVYYGWVFVRYHEGKSNVSICFL